LQRWRKVELDDRHVIGGDKLAGVFRTQGTESCLQQRPDLPLVSLCLIGACHV